MAPVQNSRSPKRNSSRAAPIFRGRSTLSSSSSSSRSIPFVSSFLLLLFLVIQQYFLLATAWQSEHTVGECPSVPIPEWDLENPSIVGAAQGVNLVYQLPNDVVGDVTYEVFEFNCINQVPNNNGDASSSSSSSSSPIVSALTWGEEARDEDSAVLDLEINPTRITEYTSIYTESDRRGSESQGDVRLCIRFNLWNLAGVLVNFLDTPVSFGVRFLVEEEGTRKNRRSLERPLSPGGVRRTRWQSEAINDSYYNNDYSNNHHRSNSNNKEEEGKALSSSSERRRRRRSSSSVSTTTTLPRNLQAGCGDNWGIHVFTCPNTTPNNLSRFSVPIETSNDPIAQGSFVHLCFQLNEEAVKDGAVLFEVSDLTYIGGGANGGGGGIVQPGVTDGEVSFDGLTRMECESDVLQMCKLESILYISFFSDGIGDEGVENNNPPRPISVEGSVAITSSSFGKRNPLKLDFNLDLEIQPAENAGGSSGNRNYVSLWIAWTMPVLWGICAFVTSL